MTKEKRLLTKEEKVLCKKGIKLRKQRILDYIEDVTYKEELNKFNKKWESYQERKKEEADKAHKKHVEETFNKLNQLLEFEQNALKSEQEMLKDGVKIKRPTGVN